MRKIVCAILIGASFFGCESEENAETNLQTTTKFEKIISDNKAKELYLNDQNTRLSKLGKTDLSLEDKASYFSITTLKNYVANLEGVANSQDIEITGVNFMFGANENGDRTVFLMPAINNSTNIYNMSFSIIEGEIKPFKQISKSLLEVENGSTDSDLILSTNGIISYNDAVVLFNEYQSKYIESIAEEIIKPYYTKSAWYSLNEINNYIDYLENVESEENITINGVNIFYGVHNSNHHRYPNDQTIFLLPTQSDNEQKGVIKIGVKAFQNILLNRVTEERNISSLRVADEFNLAPPPRDCEPDCPDDKPDGE